TCGRSLSRTRGSRSTSSPCAASATASETDEPHLAPRAGSGSRRAEPGSAAAWPEEREMNPLKSVGAKLSLALAVVVAGALGAVYLAVVPSLQRNLTQAKLRDLERVAPALRKQFQNDPLGVYDPDFVETAATRSN